MNFSEYRKAIFLKPGRFLTKRHLGYIGTPNHGPGDGGGEAQLADFGGY